MIIGIGLDAVEIKRFQNWHLYSTKRLLRIYSKEEIAYCLAVPAKSAERFAARFAAREALFKALCQAGFLTNFLSLCRSCKVAMTTNGPQLQLDNATWRSFQPLLTITHISTTAIAVVVLQLVR
jgi:phosphopantetheine--protein transferase-like protein